MRAGNAPTSDAGQQCATRSGKRSMSNDEWFNSRLAQLVLATGPIRPTEGDEFLFAPSPGFYGLIAQGSADALNEGMRVVADHIGARSRPTVHVRRTGGSISTARQDFIAVEAAAAPGFISWDGPAHSNVTIAEVNRHSHYLLGAILAHEMAHHYLHFHGVRLPDMKDNEVFTDFTAVVIGLGRLILNGYMAESRSSSSDGEAIEYSYRLGYLCPEDVAIVLAKVCVHRGIEARVAIQNLRPDAARLLRPEIMRERFSRKHPRLRWLLRLVMSHRTIGLSPDNLPF